MQLPETRYVVARDGVHIAYQVFGRGVNLVYCAEFWHSIEAQWDHPDFARFLERLGSFARVICFDQRGTGLSDPVALTELPDLQGWADDLQAIMAAADAPRAALLGSGGGGLMSIPFAATYPDRTEALILFNSTPRFTETDGFPWGNSPETEADVYQRMSTGWGRAIFADVVGPSVANRPDFREWWGRYERLGSTPGTIVQIRRMLSQADVRDVLPAIRVPTLVVHRAESRLYDVSAGRYMAEHIPGARYVELPGPDHLPFLGDADRLLDEIEEFLTGTKHRAAPDRMLATVLVTDIVGSTERAAELGDRRWRELLDRHHAAVREVLGEFRGREIDTAGDGFLVTFDGPGRAVAAAAAIRDEVRKHGLEVRAGLHTGEIEVAGPDVRGIAVHIGARVASEAGPGEILVSSTVKDLVAGSGTSFEDRGAHRLKGVPDEWHLYAVTG